MQIFLCWSGRGSHTIAQAMHTFLGDTIHELKPFLSSEDIRKGGRWNSEIGERLAECNYGILCMTKENLESRWILFEAGALSKLPTSNVTALLAGIQSTDIREPLSQFQHTGVSVDEIFKLMDEINGMLPEEKRLDSAKLKRLFDRNWAALNESLIGALKLSDAASAQVPKRETDSMVTELLELVRELKRESASSRSPFAGTQLYLSPDGIVRFVPPPPPPSSHVAPPPNLGPTGPAPVPPPPTSGMPNPTPPHPPSAAPPPPPPPPNFSSKR